MSLLLVVFSAALVAMIRKSGTSKAA